MERKIRIKTPDKKLIDGVIGTSKGKSSKLVIFVHGFTGHPNEHIFFNGSRFLTSKGFDTLRISLYAGEKGSRHFKDTSISIHGKDIDTVVKHFRKRYKKIFVIGHSYGGTSLLFTNQQNIDGYIFWDPGYIETKDTREDISYDKRTRRYILDWGIEYLIGEKFIDELKKFPDCGKLIQLINKPVLLISAGKGTTSEKYYKHAHEPKELVNIKTADHNFNSWRDEEILFNHTYRWLKRCE